MFKDLSAYCSSPGVLIIFHSFQLWNRKRRSECTPWESTPWDGQKVIMQGQEIVCKVSFQKRKWMGAFIGRALRLPFNKHIISSWASLKAQTIKNLPKCRRPRFNPWVRKIPWRREWQPISVFLPGESNGQSSLAGFSPWGSQSRRRLSNLTLSPQIIRH